MSAFKMTKFIYKSRTRVVPGDAGALLLVAGLCVALLLGACQRPIFVGLPTPTPAQATAFDEMVLLQVENPPVPPATSPIVNPVLARAQKKPRPALVLTKTPAGPLFKWHETENILVMGTDRRPDWDNWRTDTIMIVGLDRKLQRAAVLSIPRDLYIEIPNYGYGRINQVDYIGEEILKVEGGGPALVSAVLSQTLGIETKHWVRFEMTGFQSVVDAVGGVTIHLDCPFYEPILNLTTNEWEYFTLPAGEVEMDGETAYWYVRLRLRESDIGRARRQRQFLWALREQALNTNLILRFPELWSAFRETFTTDLTLWELIELARFGMALDPANVRASGITLKELQSFTTESGAAVLIIADPTKVKAVIDGVWDAPAMADTNRQGIAGCEPIPQGPPTVVLESLDPQAQPAPEAIEADQPNNGEAVGAESPQPPGGG
jgi:LCP family protein required for cell wall assembly